METVTDYRTLLREAYAVRKGANERYSLRAFARQLELAPSSLNEILSGRINLSLERALKVSGKLSLYGREKDRFLLLVRLESTKDSDLRALILEELRLKFPDDKIHDLSVDLFRTISDWHHFAILEFSYIDHLLSLKRIRETLGIDGPTAELAIDRLIRIGLLQRLPSGTYQKTHSRILTRAKAPNDAIQKSFSRFFELANEAVRTQQTAGRFTGTEFIPFDTKQIHKAKEITEKYMDDMIALSKSSNKRTSVYALGVQFFNVHKNHSKGARP